MAETKVDEQAGDKPDKGDRVALKMMVDGVEVDMPDEMVASLPKAPPRGVDYLPAYLIRERLEAAGLWSAAATAIARDPAMLLKVATLQRGLDPADPVVLDLLRAIGADASAILAPV